MPTAKRGRGRPPPRAARYEEKGQRQLRELAALTPVERYLRDLGGAPIPPDVLALLAPARRQIPEQPSAYVFEALGAASPKVQRRFEKRQRLVSEAPMVKSPKRGAAR